MNLSEGNGLLLHTSTELSLLANLVSNHIVGFRQILEGPRIERKPSYSSIDGELGDKERLIGVAGITRLKDAVLVDSWGGISHGEQAITRPPQPSRP